MRRFATLVLAALVLVPAVLAQSRVTAEKLSRIAATPTRLVAPGDTTVLSNIPEGTTQISTFAAGSNFLFGSGGSNLGVDAFGAGYTLESDAEFEVIGALIYVTASPDGGATGESFEVRVYEGAIQEGPTGEAIYTEVFPADVVPQVEEGEPISPTVLFFGQAVEIEGPSFFVTYDVDGITSQFGAGSTNILDDPTPETVVLIEGEWVPVFEAFAVEGTPLRVQLFADAIVREGGEEFVVQPVGTARDQGAGEVVTVEGTVSRAEGAFTYLQDETGGLAIRQTSGDFFDAVASYYVTEGAVVRVTGRLSEFNGLLWINGNDLEAFTVVEQAEPPEPQVVTLAELAADGEAYEGELVRVFDLTFPEDAFQFEAGTTYEVTDPTDDSGTVTVRVPNADDTQLEGGDFFGNPASVTGVVVQNSSTDPDAGYQIVVVLYGDVAANAVATADDPDGRLGLSPLAPNPAAGTAEATVTLAAPGRATVAVYDVLGREVARVLDRDLAAGDHAVRLDASDLPAGTYLVRLSAAGATVARPFTVAR